MKIKVVNKSSNKLPEYATKGSAAMDLHANLTKEWLDINANGCAEVVLYPGERILIPTGLFVEVSEGYYLGLAPRSGLALKNGITLANSPSTIDSDYRGEIGLIIINHGEYSFTIKHGDRLCQMLLKKVERIEWDEHFALEELSKSDRGEGGFGHTGK